MVAMTRQKSGREFHFTHLDFETVRKILYQHAGISLNDGKQDLVYGRLTRRLRALQLSSFDQYLCYLESEQGAPEMVHFINALTTNLTAFFREPHHFDFLADTALPEAMRKHGRDHRVRCWSAGCSTGEEPYSMAIVVREVMSSYVGWDIKILATDLDSNVVATARQGRYTGERIAGLSRSRANKWFHTMGDNVQVDASLQALITFKYLNLMHTWPMRGPFDLIFCRNVVIYFDKPTQRKLFDRYADYLADGGYLFLGHSESMHNLSDRFELIGQTMYRKVC
ncbi:MAG: protein-glutamate O-methyltransferase CheR [Gammaproteobacteria bacterium]|nr:MAG: protein-glutamate O-methyltransferase CheR [Gammaproteobacteria bacterium]